MITQHKWFNQACGMAMYAPDAHHDNDNLLQRPNRQSKTRVIGDTGFPGLLAKSRAQKQAKRYLTAMSACEFTI